MRPLRKQERRVNIDLSFCDADTVASDGYTILRLHPQWKDSRRKQPVYEINLTPWQMQRLSMNLAKALKEHRDRVATYMTDVQEALK